MIKHDEKGAIIKTFIGAFPGIIIYLHNNKSEYIQ
jgi:hypothetical protein